MANGLQTATRKAQTQEDLRVSKILVFVEQQSERCQDVALH